MGLWGHVFALGYDRFMAGTERAGLARHREALLRAASGHVLEIGGGTGANLPFYGNEVTKLTIAEPEEPMARRLRRRLRNYAIPVTVVSAIAEQLPLPPQSIDYVVSSLVLCTVRNPIKALAEVRRVLKPSGRLLFIEHVRSENPQVARWQDRLQRPWSWIGNGCHCNRTTVETISSAGFLICTQEQHELPRAPAIVRPLIVGVAKRGVQPVS